MTRHTRSVLFAVPLLVLAVALGACGGDSTGGDSDGGNATQASDHEKQLAFARCMRDNGVDMPDPKPIGDGGLAVAAGSAADANDPAFNAALEKCRSKLPNGGQPRPLTPEQREKQLAFAKCMRENGITDFPDPPAEGAPRQAPKLPKPGEPGYEAAIDGYQKAAEKCGVSGGAVMPAQPLR
jgi:hypothetical protein